jgi:hypothetical protein
MAKNKRLTYILGLLVTIVWGMITYRVFLMFSSTEEPDTYEVSIPITKLSAEDYTPAADTSILSLNSRDPFEAAEKTDTVKKAIAAPVRQTIARHISKPVNWGFIHYDGYIRNPNSNKLIAMLRVNGKSVTLSEGEASEHVRLLKNLKDSVKIAFEGRTTYIK